MGDNLVTLHWNRSRGQVQVHGYIIQRERPDVEPGWVDTLYRHYTFYFGTPSCNDRSATDPGLYRYTVRSFSWNGILSEPSEPVEVRIVAPTPTATNTLQIPLQQLPTETPTATIDPATSCVEFQEGA